MPGIPQMVAPPQPVPIQVQLPSAFPQVPDDVIARFADMQDYKDQMAEWWDQMQNGLQDWTGNTSQTISNTYVQTQNLSVQQGILKAAIVTLTNTVISGNAALATQIITVSALASSASHISAQSTAPVGPALDDIWVDTSNPAAPTTYFWNGAAWQLQTTPIIATAVSQEATARATADGNLSGKFTLTVVAGNVVTGMNITSSTGGGTNISQVIFNATDFLIYNGTSGQPMFAVSGGLITLGQTFVVDYTNQKVYIGVGTYDNTNTAFYLDSSGKFSLGTGLVWNGTTLTIVGNGTFSGALSAATGTFSGSLSAATGTFAGSLSAASGSFTGTLSAATGSFSGTITASAGTIGGFTIGSTTLSAGSGFQHVLLDSGTPWIAIGTVTGGAAPFAGMFGTPGNSPVLGVGLGGNFLGVIGLDGSSTFSILTLITHGATSNTVVSSAGVIRCFASGTTFSSFITGSNPQPTLAQYSVNIQNLNNSTDEYGLFIGTNWNALENIIINCANVDATTAAVTTRFQVRGDGTIIFGTYTAGAPGATGFVTILDAATGRSTKLLAA